MTTLNVRPDFKKKRARFIGTVAAGEKVAVTVEGGAAIRSDTLRLRVYSPNRRCTLAVFPSPDGGDAADNRWRVVGDDIACTLNLNTVQMREHSSAYLCATFAVMATLDDPGLDAMHFTDCLPVAGWMRDEGEDEPVDLSRFPGQIAEWAARMDAMELSADKAGRTVTITAWDGKGEKPDPVTVSDGKSAYEVARDNGFTGTEEQWLDSLRIGEEQIDALKSDLYGTFVTHDTFGSHVSDGSNPHNVTAEQTGALPMNGRIGWVEGRDVLHVEAEITLSSDKETKGILARLTNQEWSGPDGEYPLNAREEVQSMIDAAVGDVNAALEGVA